MDAVSARSWRIECGCKLFCSIDDKLLENFVWFSDHDDPETEFRESLLKSASKTSHSAASYQNDVEGTGVSWCIYHPEKVQILEVVSPKWQEIDRWSIKSTKHEDFGLGRLNWKSACDAAGKVL